MIQNPFEGLIDQRNRISDDLDKLETDFQQKLNKIGNELSNETIEHIRRNPNNFIVHKNENICGLADIQINITNKNKELLDGEEEVIKNIIRESEKTIKVSDVIPILLFMYRENVKLSAQNRILKKKIDSLVQVVDYLKEKEPIQNEEEKKDSTNGETKTDGHSSLRSQTKQDDLIKIFNDRVKSFQFASNVQSHHNNVITSLTISPDSQFLITASQDCTIAVQKIRYEPTKTDTNISFSLFKKFNSAHSNIVSSIACTHVSNDPEVDFLIVSGGEDQRIKCWCIRNNEPRWTGKHPSAIATVAIDNQGVNRVGQHSLVASAGSDPAIYLWDLFLQAKHVKPRTKIENCFEQGARSLAFLRPYSPEQNNLPSLAAQKIIAHGNNGVARSVVKMFDVETSKKDLEITNYGFAQHVIVSNCQNSVILATNDSCIRIYDLRSGNLIGSFTAHSGQKGIGQMCSFDDKWLITTGIDDMVVKVWDWKEKRLVKTFIGHNNDVRAVGIDQTAGRWIISGGNESHLKLWK